MPTTLPLRRQETMYSTRSCSGSSGCTRRISANKITPPQNRFGAIHREYQTKVSGWPASPMPQSNAFICILLASLLLRESSCSMNDAYQLFSEGNLIGSFGDFAGDGCRRWVRLSTPDPPCRAGTIDTKHEVCRRT